MTGDARFSPCGNYRYELTRRWDDGPLLTFVMLNPSTADAVDPDPTIRRCIGFAKRDNWSGIRVVNLFALRSPYPKVLPGHPDPVGPENDAEIKGAIHTADDVIFAWGRLPSKALRYRVEQVRALVAGAGMVARCFGYTADRSPRHPLMLASVTPLEDYAP